MDKIRIHSPDSLYEADETRSFGWPAGGKGKQLRPDFLTWCADMTKHMTNPEQALGRNIAATAPGSLGLPAFSGTDHQAAPLKTPRIQHHGDRGSMQISPKLQLDACPVAPEASALSAGG